MTETPLVLLMGKTTGESFQYMVQPIHLFIHRLVFILTTQIQNQKRGSHSF